MGALTRFLNELHVDHLVLEMAHRPPADLDAFKDVDPQFADEATDGVVELVRGPKTQLVTTFAL